MAAAPPITTAAVLATGEELLRGAVVDTNSGFVARRLRRLGVLVVEFRQVSDGLSEITAALRDLCARVDLLVVTGGVGPTEDDRTRHALAAAAGVELVVDPQAEALVAAWFARLGRKPSASNARQTLLPVGARAVENPVGSAPGIEISIGRALVLALPGVPAEMRAMVESAVVPRVQARGTGPAIAERLLQVVGLPESVVGERVAEWMRRKAPMVSDNVHYGVITLCASDRDDVEGRARLDECVASMRAALGDHLFAEGDVSLAAHVIDRLRERRATLALAESCTGGRVSAALTDVPGASEVLIEGCVTYANESKVRRLGVSFELLEWEGAVSEAVARAMAAGIRERAGTTFGLSITGVAGPGGGSDAKPVGTVHLAVAGPGGSEHVARRFPGGRDAVQSFAVMAALDLLRRALH